MDTIPSFGYWLRRQRKALDLTQQALADKVGCSLAAIKKIEAEERRPSRQIAERMAQVLSVPASQREIFIEVARGTRPIEQLILAHDSTEFNYAPPKEKPLHNLPIQLTSFIGRRKELAEVKSLLSNTRLLTLIGPGGTGKSRLAMQVGQEIVSYFAHGVWLVELASLADPSLIPQSIASVFNLREAPSTALIDIVVNYLRTKHLLLILDNCEHLIAESANLSANLLHTCPQLKILISSREALGLSGETVYRVPSLSLPEPTQKKTEEIMKSESVQLLFERAKAFQPHFILQEGDVSAVTQICNRLDGIPLALELAAARLAVFSVKEITSRLDDRFRLLTGGSRTALERHQTLRALIDWSYDLLNDDERRLFSQLSVFSGGWTYQAVETIFPELDVLNLLTQLVNKSLVMVDELEQGRRYHLPETIRQYARDKLLDSGEAERVRDKHLQFFLQLVEDTEPKLRGSEQIIWLNHLEGEHDNLRAALSWSIEGKKAAQALQLSGALNYFWVLRGHWTEGKMWLDDALALADQAQNEKDVVDTRVETSRRAKALYGAAWMHLLIADASSAHNLLEKSLGLFRQVGDKWWTAIALELLGLILATEGDYQTARTRVEEGVSVASETDDPWPLAVCLVRLGDSLKGKDLSLARAYLERGIIEARCAGDRSVLSEGLREFGSVCVLQGDFTTAMQVIEEALVEARLLGSLIQILLALHQLVIITGLGNDMARAKAYCFEFWSLGKDYGNPLVWLFTILNFGLVEIFSGQSEKGVIMLVATDTLALQWGIVLNVAGEATYTIFMQAMAKARQQLSKADYEAAMQEGRQLTLEQALALAIGEEAYDLLPQATSRI